MAEPYWLDEPSHPFPSRAPAGADDVAVVGGGVTGLSCALTLAEHGMRVRVHEARTIASGASGRNGGFALRGAAMPYDRARERLGADRASALWRWTEETLDRMEGLAGDALRRVGSLRLAADEKERDELIAEHEALRSDGFAVEWLDELDEPLAANYAGAVLHPRDGALHPGRWIRELARRAAQAGVDVREHDRVESLSGIDADVIVIASDGYPSGVLGEVDELVQPTRGQVVVTEPLAVRLYERPHYARYGFDYWQQTDDDRLILGGRRDTRLDHEFTAEETVTEPIQRALEAFAEELIGERPKITHRWAGIFGQSPDLMPLAGPVPGRDDVWVAAAYSGHGNVLGFRRGELVAQAILGRPAPELDLFDPSRLL